MNGSIPSDVVVERALGCLGKGFDVNSDFRAKYCKGERRLVELRQPGTGSDVYNDELAVPGFGVFRGVSPDIFCDKGDLVRYQSGFVDFEQMSLLLNQRSSLPSRIPSGHFNALFASTGGCWHKDVLITKRVALDGYFISLFNLYIHRRPLTLSPHVVQAVPSVWDPHALARFIVDYGTHVIVGLSVGGQDLVTVRQDQSSSIPVPELKDHLDNLGDQLFTGTCTLPATRSRRSAVHATSAAGDISRYKQAPDAFNGVFDPKHALGNGLPVVSCKDGITVICSKRGGDTSASSHSEWLPTVTAAPDVIGFTFIPITDLLHDVPGRGFLCHAINLYLRYKPPISHLERFLDFQSHTMWAPELNDLPLGPCSNRPSLPTNSALQFSFGGPKLPINTSQVVIENGPIIGMRLYLEGKKSNRLAVHLQHLSTPPASITSQISGCLPWKDPDEVDDQRFFEPVQKKAFSHVCTAPVKYDPQWSTDNVDGGSPSAFIVTGAQLVVREHKGKSVLHLRLRFSRVSNCIVERSDWDQGPSSKSQKSSTFLSTVISTTFSTTNNNAEKCDKQQQPVIDSGIFPGGPPMPVNEASNLSRFVDTRQVCRGPRDNPGHWLVTGAKLVLNKGKIGISVKFSLLYPVPMEDGDDCMMS